MRFTILLILALFTFPIVTKATDCTFAPTATLSGQVTTTGGTPIYRPTLQMYNPDGSLCQQVYGSAFGYYSFQPVFSQTYVVVVSKKMFQSQAQPINLLQDMIVNWQLVPQ